MGKSKQCFEGNLAQPGTRLMLRQKYIASQEATQKLKARLHCTDAELTSGALSSAGIDKDGQVLVTRAGRAGTIPTHPKFFTTMENPPSA